MVLVRDNEYEWWFMTDGRLMAPISAAFLYGDLCLIVGKSCCVACFCRRILYLSSAPTE